MKTIIIRSEGAVRKNVLVKNYKYFERLSAVCKSRIPVKKQDEQNK